MAEELTPEQKKQKRNEYARAYYAKNKAKMKDAAKARGGKTTVDKKTEKLAVKGAKTMAAAKEILACAAAVMSEAYKTGDQKIVDHTAKLFKKQLGLATSHNEEDGTVELALDIGVKKVRLPKEFAKGARRAAVIEQDIEDTPEVAMDPDMVAAIADGADPAEFDTEDVDQNGDSDLFADDEEEENDEEEEDEEDLEDDDSDVRGRADWFREMEAMGVGEEDM